MTEQRADSAAAAAVETAFFSRTFDEATAMTREAHDYLAEHGEAEMRRLKPRLQLFFSAESMRLTSRLTYVMAWLMAQRAAYEGEISVEELRREGWRLGGRDICLAGPVADPALLPPYLRDLLRRSEALFRRVARLDDMVAGGPE